MINLREIKTNLEVFYSQDNFDYQENIMNLDNFDGVYIYSDYENLEYHYKKKFGYSLSNIDINDLFTIDDTNKSNNDLFYNHLVNELGYDYNDINHLNILDFYNDFTDLEDFICFIQSIRDFKYKKHFEYLEINGYNDVFKVIVLIDELKEIWGNTPNIEELTKELYNYAYRSTLQGTLNISFEYTVNAVNHPISIKFEYLTEILNNSYDLDFDYSAIHNTINNNSPYPLNITELKPLFEKLETYSYTDIEYLT